MHTRHIFTSFCLLILLAALAVTPGTANSYSALSSGTTGDSQVLSTPAYDKSVIMNTLPEEDEDGNVINPYQEAIRPMMNSLPEVDEDGNVINSYVASIQGMMNTLPEEDEDGNVINTYSDAIRHLMNTLPEVDEDGNVINPYQEAVRDLMNTLPEEESIILFDISNTTGEERFSHVSNITLTCPGTVSIIPTSGVSPLLYALQETGETQAPEAAFITDNYTLISEETGNITSLDLEAGSWWLLVEGEGGEGVYSMVVSSVCTAEDLPAGKALPEEEAEADTSAETGSDTETGMI